MTVNEFPKVRKNAKKIYNNFRFLLLRIKHSIYGKKTESIKIIIILLFCCV